ncbi:MAG: alpha/beta hydrolase [Gammaproteobacteria bacterium]|nr:alpha/beta hydrolase [Gammaproteobacteria bacterium]
MTESSTETAGFRNAEWTMQGLPDSVKVGVFPLKTADGAATNGFLYIDGNPETVVCIMHPREFLATHYFIPYLLNAGFAVWTQTPRSVGSDLRLEHELALHEVAAGMNFLQGYGLNKVVLLGNSGGAGLYAFYNQQSKLGPEERLARTPAGRPTKLSEASMPVADAVVLVAPHPGQGALLMNCIDPSVLDEDDALSCDPHLDPFDPNNGFRNPPESSSYATEFVERYRLAQRERVMRIDGKARDMLAGRLRYKSALKDKDAPLAERKRAGYGGIFQVWRTDADLRCWDLSLDPSDRAVGSVWGRNPYASNFGSVGFGRICTAESWLSTWSGISSNALLEKTASSITQSSLVIGYTADNTVFPGDVRGVFESLPASDKHMEMVEGDHHGRGGKDGRDGREICAAHVTGWLRERFAA